VTDWRRVGIFMDVENRLEWNMTAAERLSPLRAITNNLCEECRREEREDLSSCDNAFSNETDAQRRGRFYGGAPTVFSQFTT